LPARKKVVAFQPVGSRHRFRSLRLCGGNRETGNNVGATRLCRVTCGGRVLSAQAREAAADRAVEREALPGERHQI